ncbi:MAG: glycosyltransferase family 39 protein [Ferruginibacter sp.]|jgi:4-amino-4-deoxy-L-arabinose transferase-like glycosyltransferase|nr:glycosyltransferase family 39 protein [Ferruginibacter sp.]
MPSGINNIKLPKNPWLLFLPFLVLYIIFVLIFPTTGHQGDEERYLMFANNLVNGFYSPPAPDINLTNGPGWPIILMPFIALGLPLITITIANAFFYYLSIIFLYKALKETVSYQLTLLFSMLWACYYVAFQNMPFTHTETITYLLVSVLVFSMVKAFKPGAGKESNKYILLAGFMIGYIVLTKVAFGFVLIFMLAGTLILWLTNRRSVNYKKGLFIMLIGLATVSPYMIYIYQLTGRVLYWSTTAGSTLYWSSTPYKEEYGDWKLELKQGPVEMGNYNIPGSGDTLVAHHQEDYNEIYKYKGVEQDDVWKRKAIENIKKHPGKYLQNCVYNIGRLVFHYPFSQAVQRPKVLLVFPANGIILTMMLFCIIPTFKNWRKVSYPIRFMLFFTILYLGASTLVTAYVRMFTIIVPILLFWFAYIFSKTVKVNLGFSKTEEV